MGEVLFKDLKLVYQYLLKQLHQQTVLSWNRSTHQDPILYISRFKFYMTEIQKSTNKLTLLNNRILNGETDSFYAGLTGRTLRQKQALLYQKLLSLIWEMDCWNYFIRNSLKDGARTTPGHH